MTDTQNIDIEQKDVLGAPRRVRTTDPDVFSDPESARVAARRLGCIGIRRYLNRSGGESWMPCTNESDYRKYSGIGVSGRRFRRQQLERDIRQITGRGKLAKKTLEEAVETKASKKNNYTKPELRERIKQRIMAGSEGGAPGQWSARKAQMLAQAYKKAGGGYKTGGKSKTQRSLSSWTKEKWTTSDGKKARRGSYTRRYLPAKAWSKLTPAQRAATNRKKIQGSRSGEQFVPNTDAARTARKRSVRGVKHVEFYDGIETKSIDGLIEEKALSRRSSRRTLRTPGALRPRLGATGQDMNPATARDEDLDGLVLEGIPTINRGRGVIDPTPGGRPSRWVPRMRPQRTQAPTPEEKPQPRRQLLQRPERLPKPKAEKVRESKLNWLPEDADKWTEDDAQRLLDTQKASGLSYGEFAKQNGLFANDVRESVERQKSRRKKRISAFRKNNPKLFAAVNSFGAVKDEAMEAVSRGKVNNWGSLVSWAFKDNDLKRQRLNDRAVNDLFNNVSNGLDPDGKSDVVLGFVPSRTKQGEMTKTFARANNLPDGFVSRYKTPRTAIQPARRITSTAERAERRGERRVGRISRDIEATARAFERFDAISGRMGGISGRMATPSGPDSQWTNQEKAQWKAGQWRKRFLFDEALSTARVNLSPEMQAHIAKYPDAATAARAILDLSDQDLDKLFKGHNDALKAANVAIKPPRKDELPLLPSEVAAAAQIKRPLVRSFLDEYKKMAPNGTLSRLDVDVLSNEDIEELFNRYILPEMVDPTKLDAAGVIDVAQRISQPGQENSPLRLLDNLAYMAGDDAMSLEARRRVLQEKLAAGVAQGTMTPAQQQATQNALDALDEELAKLIADYEAGKPLDSSIPLQPLDDPRQMPRWAGGRRALSFEDPVTADDYIMFLLENNDIGFHPEWGPITKPEWENWSEDIQERAAEAERVYREGGELEAKDAIDALNAEYQQWTQVGLEAGWIQEPEEDEEFEEPQPERPIRDEFGVLDEDWVWNTEHGSPEELGVTDDPATWAQHPDNVEDDGVTLIPLDELEELILKYAPKQFQADLLEILKPSEWTDPHNGHIDQRYIDLPPELIDYFVGQAMGTMPPTPSSSGQMPTPNLGGIQGDGVGLSDPGGPRLRKGIPFIPRNINWDSALRMFQRILNKQGKQASSKGSYATASRQYDPALGVYDDWGALQLQNQFVEAAKEARELYVTGTGQDSRKAREQVWNLLQSGRTPQEISHELIIFGADQPDTNRPPQPIDLRDLVKAAATQYAIDNNIKTSDVTKLLNAADQAFNSDTARQEAFRRSQLERLRDDLTRLFSGQSPQQIISSIDGLIEETERKKWFADQAYRIERGHDARLRKAALDLAESYPVPTARRAIFMEPDGTITDSPSRRAKALYQEPYTGEVTDDDTRGWPQAFDEGYDPTQISRARHANRIYRWWRQNWGYIERNENGEITREYVGPLQGTLKAHQLHARKYGNEGLAGTTAYATRTADSRVQQLREVKRTIEGARQEGRGMGISGFMRSGGPNLYDEYSRKAARVLVSGRRKNKPSSMLLGYDSDEMPITRAMRTAFSGGSGKFLGASNEHSFAALMNPENVDYFKHLSPVEKDYFRALYSNPDFVVAVSKDVTAPLPNRTRGASTVSPDEAIINAFRSSMDATRPTISGQMGLRRTLSNASRVARYNPERWQREYLTARNSFRMTSPFRGKKKQNYKLEQITLKDSVFKPVEGLYLVDADTKNVIDGPFKSDELGLLASEKAKGAETSVISKNYPRPWEQMPEIQELIANGVSNELRDFMTLDSHKISDIRSTVYDTIEGKINQYALDLDKGVPQKASDTAIFSRDPDTGALMVLLIQRAFGPHKDDTGAWVLPGGFADPGETALETALRELEEEVGLKVSPTDARVKQIGTITAPDWDVRFTKGVEVSGTALFVSPDAAFKAGDDALRAQWFPVQDIADGKLPIGFGHVAWIKNAMALEVDDPANYGPDYESLRTGLDRVERATRARNKELIEISNSWRKELNKGRAKADKIKLFDEKNLGSYSAWELAPSDDMMRLGSISRMRLMGREVTPESIAADVERTRENRLSRVGSNFGPSISGRMGEGFENNMNDMHLRGMSSDEIKNKLRQENGVSEEDINRYVLYSGIQLSKTSDNVSASERKMFDEMISSGGSIRDLAKKNKISFTEAMDVVVKVESSIGNREPAINAALRKAIMNDSFISGAEKAAMVQRLHGASRASVAKFMGMSVERYGEVEASIIDNLKARNPKMFKSAGAWSSNPESLFAEQDIFMRYVHGKQPLNRIAEDLGMTEKMVDGIVKRYARWKNSNAPLERAAIKQSISQFGSALNAGEIQMMRRLSDGENIFQFSERTNMPKKAAIRMYNSAMRKMHMESGVSPLSRNFDANIYKAIPKEWISPSFLFEKNPPKATRAISGKMSDVAKSANKFNAEKRSYMTSPMSALREKVKDIRQEMRDQIQNLSSTSAYMHPVFGGQEGIDKMAALGAYIKRTIDESVLEAVVDAARKSGSRFSGDREEIAKRAMNKARKSLMEDLWMKREMIDFSLDMHEMIESASWPWRMWQPDSPEWQRHRNIPELMETYKTNTPKGRQAYINAGFYMPLGDNEMFEFLNAVEENNSISGRMSNPRQWAQSRDLYDIIGVSETATDEELKKAFRAKSRVLHPDVNNSPDATEQFKELGFAWETLSNSRLRNQYDSWRAGRTSRQSSSARPNNTDIADDDIDVSQYTDQDLYLYDDKGRLWPRHNANRDDWPTAPFTQSTVFPQRQWVEKEFDEWSDWTRHGIQPSRPAGSALWGEGRGTRDLGGDGEIDDDGQGGPGPSSGPRGPFNPTSGSPANAYFVEQQVRRDLGPDATDEEVLAELIRRMTGGGRGPSMSSSPGSISGRMSSSFPPLDDSVQKRLGLQNLPSSYDQSELTKQHPKLTFDVYKANIGEPSVEVTTTFGGKSNVSKYRYDNVYRPIIDALVAGVQRPTGGKRKFVSVGGPAGSGKTTDRKTGAHNIPTPGFALHVDADEIKTLLPEARALHAAGNPMWANAVHEESRVIADLALQEAISQGLDVVYDSTGQYNSGFETLQAARSAGYDIVMHYNTATPDALAESLERRSLTDPRSLPGHFNSAVMGRNRQIMPSVAKAADEFYLWDSTDISSRRLLASKPSASSPLEIKHEDAYVYADFDEATQKVKRGGRPTARLFQNRYAAESPEGKAIESFDAGQSIEDIASSSDMSKDRIFNVVTTGVIDPNMQYRPPVQPSSRPLISPEKKIDDFVSDDALESTWKSLTPAQQSIVKDVLNKTPGAMDAFENEELPMDIIIWAAQNGDISGRMSSAGIKKSAENQAISGRERSAARKARQLIANKGKYSEIKKAMKEAFTGVIVGNKDYIDRTKTNRGNEFNVIPIDVKVTNTGDGGYDRGGYTIPANKTRIEISGLVFPKHLGTNPSQLNDNNSLASFDRVLYFDDNSAEAEHKGMVVKFQQQGLGIGTALNARNEEIYRELGISEISLYGDNYSPEGLFGASHWPRNGYYWYDEDAKNKFLKKLSESVNDIFRGKLGDSERKTRDEIRALIKKSRKDKFGEGVTPEELLAWEDDGVTLPDTRIRYRRAVEPVSVSGRMGGSISGRITQPAEGWESFNSRREMRNAPKYRGKPWKDVKESLGGEPWPFKGQASQFDKKGPPGFSYFKGTGNGLQPGQWVDCLLWRDEKGILKGIVYHYPQDLPLEKKGNVNIFISPDSKRKGIASTLLSEAIKRYNVDLRQQRYSEEGARFVNQFVRRLPENSGGQISGSMATRYDKDRYSKEDVQDAILDVYGRGLQVADALEALRNEYDILMDRTDWTARLTRMRKAGILESYRLPNKEQTARKIKKSLTQKFVDKRIREVQRLIKSRPNLTHKEIAEIINTMPIPDGVNVARMTTGNVTNILRKGA